MIKKNIPVNVPLFIGNEQKYLRKCIDTGWIGSDGKFVKEFENKSSFVNRKYSIAVSVWKCSIRYCFKALELNKDDEVILPSFTMHIICLNPIIKCSKTNFY